MRRYRLVRVPLLLLVGAFVVGSLVGCGSGSEGSGADPSVPSSTAEVTTTSSATTTPVEATTTDSGGAGLQGATLDEQSGARVGSSVALLTAVRVAPHPGFDRVVFEFQGDALPEWTVAYADGPFSSDGEGGPISVDGSSFLQVTMQGASGFNLDSGEQTYNGPTTVPGAGAKHVQQVVRQGDFEALMQWVVGSDQKVPFKVTPLTKPSRLVVDLATI